jgi:diamine N-acetyltransferase
MLSDGITVVNPGYLGPYFLWRLLIDQRYQGGPWERGTESGGRARTRAARCAGAGHFDWARPGLASRLLLAGGFPATGGVHRGELVLELDLLTSPSRSDRRSDVPAALDYGRASLCAGTARSVC